MVGTLSRWSDGAWIDGKRQRPMTKPIPDKAEVALEYPDKLYIGTFERSSRFDAHLDKTGISLSLQRTGEIELRKSIRMHFHYALFAEILQDLAKTVSKMPPAESTAMCCGREQRLSTARSAPVRPMIAQRSAGLPWAQPIPRK